MSAAHKFEHEAMKTSFTIRIPDADAELARKASFNAFELLDELEQKLSRYTPGGDIWQINHMRAGDSLLISDHAYQCLRLGLQAHMDTGGLFDPTLGAQIERYKQKQSGRAPEVTGQLMIDPERPAVHCVEAGREIDLGGIGKGFALDQVGLRLREWGIDCALVSAGASTQLALGPQPWTIEMTGAAGREPVTIEEQALSASGTEIQGAHILHPNQDAGQPLEHARVWVICATAALADAWSTAAMLAPPQEIARFEAAPIAVFYEEKGRFKRLPPS